MASRMRRSAAASIDSPSVIRVDAAGEDAQRGVVVDGAREHAARPRGHRAPARRQLRGLRRERERRAHPAAIDQYLRPVRRFRVSTSGARQVRPRADRNRHARRARERRFREPDADAGWPTAVHGSRDGTASGRRRGDVRSRRADAESSSSSRATGRSSPGANTPTTSSLCTGCRIRPAPTSTASSNWRRSTRRRFWRSSVASSRTRRTWPRAAGGFGFTKSRCGRDRRLCARVAQGSHRRRPGAENAAPRFVGGPGIEPGPGAHARQLRGPGVRAPPARRAGVAHPRQRRQFQRRATDLVSALCDRVMG